MRKVDPNPIYVELDFGKLHTQHIATNYSVYNLHSKVSTSNMCFHQIILMNPMMYIVLFIKSLSSSLFSPLFLILDFYVIQTKTEKKR